MSMKVKVKKIGVSKIQSYLKRLGNRMEKANKRIAKKAATWAATEAQVMILSQDFEGAEVALTAEYLNRKLNEGYSGEVLMRTSTYVKLIKPHLISDTSYTVGVKKGTVKDGVDYFKVALFLEFGTKLMPARPLWRSVEQRVKKELPKIYEQVYREMVMNDLTNTQDTTGKKVG